MKYLFKRDTILVTITVFIVMGLLSTLPFNLHFLEPVKAALYDFDYNDLSYARLNKTDAPFDERIVIVNVGDTDRLGIAAILQKTSKMGAGVIGVDLLFETPKDPKADTILAWTIQSIPNLVLCNKIDDKKATGYFNQYANSSGYANFYGEKGNVVRYFAPVKNINGTQYKSFAAAITSMAAPDAYNTLRTREKRVEAINYRRHQSKYLIVNFRDLLSDNVAPESIAGKIVLVGYANANPYDVEDKFFTPMNTAFMGKSLPDTYGVLIHANIISMILDRDYIYCSPWWLNWLLAVIIGWIYISIYIRYFLDKHIWFHLIITIIELISISVFVVISLLLFNNLNLKIDFSITFGIILLAAELLYFHHGLAIWLHKRFKLKTIFYHPDH